MKLNKNWPLLLILTVTVSFFSCLNGKKGKESRSSKGGIPVGGEITLAIPKIDISLDPSKMNTSDASFISAQIHGTLVRSSVGDTRPVPCIAERWELDQTGTIWLFHLREDMAFQSTGCLEKKQALVSADHVINSLTGLCGKGAEGAFFDSFRNHILGANAYFNGTEERVSGIEKLDDYTIKITLNRPNRAFIYLLTEPACAIVYPCDDESIVASGPFEPRYNEGHLSLIRSKAYPIQDEFGNQLPYLDKVVFEHFANKESEIEAFFNGQVDGVSNIYPDPISSILDTHIEDFSGPEAKFVMQRNGQLASYDLYSLYRSELGHFSPDFQGRTDLSRVTIKQ